MRPSPQWSLGDRGGVYGPSSDLTNPFTIHHLQQLVWLRSINSPSDRRCLCRFLNKPPGHGPSLKSINTAACGPLLWLGLSWAQQSEECEQYQAASDLVPAPSFLPSEKAELFGGLWLLSMLIWWPCFFAHSLFHCYDSSSPMEMELPGPWTQASMREETVVM